jgi:hypothetical protein
MFNSLPPSTTILRKDKAKFKASFRNTYIHTYIHTLFLCRLSFYMYTWFIIPFCTIILVLQTVNLGFVSPCIIIHSNKSPTRSGWDRPQPTTLLPPRFNGKPEAATAVYKLLMMGKKIPETCLGVFERRAINLRYWYIWLVDLFEFKL